MFSIYESTYSQLYGRIVDAFPNTTKRQYAVDPIQISNVQIIPFVGLRTLFLKADAINEDRQYAPMLLFKNIQYTNSLTSEAIEVSTADGRQVRFHRPLIDENELALRCSCGDFYWRFNYFDHLDRSLYGRKRAKYEAKKVQWSVNPSESPGLCKHLIKMMQVLKESGLVH